MYSNNSPWLVFNFSLAKFVMMFSANLVRPSVVFVQVRVGNIEIDTESLQLGPPVSYIFDMGTLIKSSHGLGSHRYAGFIVI